jgi:hypothetical protein
MVVASGDDSGAGGLACAVLNYGRIVSSFASGSVTVGRSRQYHDAAAGGLVGGAGFSGSAVIDSSFALGSVVGGIGARVGGLVGEERSASTTHSYALGSVNGGNHSSVGGLLGLRNNGSFEQNYSVGHVAAGNSGSVGGLIGHNHVSPHNRMQTQYWDVDTSGTNVGCGTSGCVGLQGLSDAQLKSALPDGFDPEVWGQNASINNGYPYLLANPPPKGDKATKHRRRLD